MIIICNECESTFKFDDSLIENAGSKVRCSKCQNVFLVYPANIEAASTEESAISVFESNTEIQDQTSEDILEEEPVFPIEYGLEEEPELLDETSSPEIGLPELELDPEITNGDSPGHSLNASEICEEDTELLDLKAQFDDDETGEVVTETLTVEIASIEENESYPAVDQGEAFDEVDPEKELEGSIEGALPDIEDLIDFGEGTETTQRDEDLDDNDELDFSDLEKMLEPNEPAEGEFANDEKEEYPGLILAIDTDNQSNDQEPKTDLAMGSDDINDELDLHKFLESLENPVDENDIIDTPEDFDFSSKEKGAGDETSAEKEFEIHLGPDGELVEKEVSHGGAEMQARESEPEPPQSDQTQSEENSPEPSPAQHNVKNSAENSVINSVVEQAPPVFTETGALEAKTEETVLISTQLPPVESKPKSRRPTLIILSIFLLITCILGVTQFNGIKLPFLHNIYDKLSFISSNIQADDRNTAISNETDVTGNSKINLLDATISGKFIDNSKMGSLFVISGYIRNEYDHPRSFIRVSAKLYAVDKSPLKASAVYCGNVISDQELRSIDSSAIGRRLQNRQGDNKMNVDIKSGGTIPFMIVFYSLPDNLEEYSVEVSSSS